MHWWRECRDPELISTFLRSQSSQLGEVQANTGRKVQLSVETDISGVWRAERSSREDQWEESLSEMEREWKSVNSDFKIVPDTLEGTV